MLSQLSIFNQMSLRAKIGIITGAIIVLALTILAFIWLLNRPYAILFADLEARDAAAVINQLEQMKVEYRLDERGDRIMVPEDEVHELRLKLMGTDLTLSGGVGFEIFDNSDFGMTEFSQRINFQRALQGELARTIMSLQSIKFARVHLVIPERSLFQQQNSNPSASVTLLLKNNGILKNEQITGIQRLIASAVQGMQIQHVTVTDQNGLTLSQPVSDNQGVQAISGRLQQKKAVEQYLSDKLNQVLVKALGLNQVMVSVDASLDFNQVKTTRESVIPVEGGHDDGVLRRRESSFGGDIQKNSKGNITTEVEYQLGRSIAEIVETPGKILKLSVGVLVPTDIDEERRKHIRALVKVTIGIDEARGDSIALYPVSFPDTQSDQLDPLGHLFLPKELPEIESEKNHQANTLISAITEYTRQYPAVVIVISMLGGGLVLIFLMKILSLRERQKNPSEQSMTLSEREKMLRQLQSWLNAEEKPGHLGAQFHE